MVFKKQMLQAANTDAIAPKAHNSECQMAKSNISINGS